MNPKRLTFTNRNGFELAAHLYMPANQKPRFFALFAHCFTCSKNFSAVTRICTALSQNGIGILSFDFTGLGMSEGKFAESNFSSNVSDLLDASDFLSKKYQAPKMLIGHSLGGAAVLYAAVELNDVKAIVTIAAPAYPAHVRKLLVDSLADIEKNGSAQVFIGGRPFKIGKSFVDDLEQKPLDTFLKKLRKSLLIMHSPQDEIVDISNAAEIYGDAFHPKSFISLDGANHLVSDPKDSDYIAEMVGSWSKRYLTIEMAEEKNDTRGNQVFVRLSGEKYTTEVMTPNHHLIADEPTEVGGADLGPNPYDLLMASLGSCTAMTLKMYAERKKWPMEEVSVFLNHEKIHLADSENPEKSSAKVSQFTRVIEIEGDLDSEQRQKLLEISNKCPVHRTLQEEIVIQTMLAK